MEATGEADEIGVAEEVVVETTRPAKKRTRLLKSDIDSACKNMLLLSVDPGLRLEAMPHIVTKVEADATHFEAFPSRKKLWEHIKTSNAFSELVGKLIVGYVELYKAHRKGKDKYSRFLVAWHELFSRYAVHGSDSEDITWRAVASDGDDLPHQPEDRSAIVTSIAKAVYELLTEKATQTHQLSATACSSDTKYPQSSSPTPDDDASVVRVAGFALHATVKYRKNALLPKNRHKHSSDARCHFRKELELLNRMKCPAADKSSFMPSVVQFQDWGV